MERSSQEFLADIAVSAKAAYSETKPLAIAIEDVGIDLLPQLPDLTRKMRSGDLSSALKIYSLASQSFFFLDLDDSAGAKNSSKPTQFGKISRELRDESILSAAKLDSLYALNQLESRIKGAEEEFKNSYFDKLGMSRRAIAELIQDKYLLLANNGNLEALNAAADFLLWNDFLPRDPVGALSYLYLAFHAEQDRISEKIRYVESNLSQDQILKARERSQFIVESILNGDANPFTPFKKG